MAHLNSFLKTILSAVLLLSGMTGWGQAVDLTTLGTPVTYDFTGFDGTADPTDWVTANAASFSDWKGSGTGTSTAGGKYSFGNTGSGPTFDGSLGFLPSGTRAIYASISFTNTTGSPITNFDIAYTAEHWRSASGGRLNGWAVGYEIESSGSYTNVASLTYVAPNNIATGGGPHGSSSLSANVVATIDVGETIEIRFFGDNGTGGGSRQGVAIDDFSFTPNGAASTITSAADGNWNATATWVGGVVPTPSDNAVIAHNVTVATGSGFANNITVQSSETLDINNGATLELSGDITNNGTININHGGALLQTTTGNSGSGTYNVTRTETFQDHSRYSFWSSPVSGEYVGDVFTGTNTLDWIEWDYTSTGSNGAWATLTNQQFEQGIGYGFTPTDQGGPSTASVNDTRTFISSTINNGTIDVDLTNASGGDYVLVGNPYPSDISISEFYNDNTAIIENAVYIWSDNATDFNDVGGYYTRNSSGTVGTDPSNQTTSPTAGVIAPMQGFFVQLVSNPSGSITFNNSQRATGNSNFLKTDPSEYAWLSLAHESGTGNQVVVGLKDQAVAGYAQGEDSPCLKMSATMAFYVTDPAKDLTIEYRPKPSQSLDYVPLGLDAWATGTYTFALDSTRNWDAAVPVMLLDSMLGQMVDLHQTDYTVNVNSAGPIRDRFYLVLDGATVGEEELTSEADSWYWYQAGDKLHIEGTNAEHITLRNTHGQTVAEVSHQTNLRIEGLARGIYILEVATAGTTTAKKVVLK